MACKLLRLVLAATLLGVALAFTGCGGGGSSDSDPTGTSPLTAGTWEQDNWDEFRWQ